MVRGRRVAGDDADRRQPLGHAGLRIGLAQKALRAGLMDLGHEAKAAWVGCPLASDRPAGQDAGERAHVLLAIPAFDAQRMQFQQLAAQVLVQAALAAQPHPRVRSDRDPIVEIKAHGRVLDHRQHHILEPAVEMRPDRLTLETAGQRPYDRTDARHREMIGPETDQALDERRRAAGNRIELGGRLDQDGLTQALLLGQGLRPLRGLDQRHIRWEATRICSMGALIQRGHARRALRQDAVGPRQLALLLELLIGHDQVGRIR